MTAEERLLAYVDGQLPADERAAFEAEMAGDPRLAAQVTAHAALRLRIAGAYAPVLDEPVPARLTAVASAANDRGGAKFDAPQWAAMAACLALGVLAGRLLWPEQGPLAAHGGVLIARGGLERALTTRLASDAGPIRVGLSFRARDGRYCRTFDSAADRLAGLACRQDGRWIAQVATASNGEPASGYRTAASSTPPAVLAAVDGLIAGEAFDATAERAARDRGWAP